MARLVADNEAAKAKNESLEKRLASLQNDFVRQHIVSNGY